MSNCASWHLFSPCSRVCAGDRCRSANRGRCCRAYEVWAQIQKRVHTYMYTKYTYHCNGNRCSRLNTTHCGIDPQDTLRYHKQRMLPTETRARNPEGTAHRGKSSRSMLQHNTRGLPGRSKTTPANKAHAYIQQIYTFAKQPVVSA